MIMPVMTTSIVIITIIITTTIIIAHLCIEALIIWDGDPVEEQALLDLPRPLLYCVCHVPVIKSMMIMIKVMIYDHILVKSVLYDHDI